jgi:hypothetical protein
MVQYFVSAGRMFNWIGISRSGHGARESWLAEVEDASVSSATNKFVEDVGRCLARRFNFACGARYISSCLERRSHPFPAGGTTRQQRRNPSRQAV